MTDKTKWDLKDIISDQENSYISKYSNILKFWKEQIEKIDFLEKDQNEQNFVY